VNVHLVNPSDLSFGVGVITPRWLFTLASATPDSFGVPKIVDETVESIEFDTIAAGDVVGIGIHTLNCRRGYEVGQEAKKRGAQVVYGGIHATLFPDEARELGAADAVVKGDGDQIWGTVLDDMSNGRLERIYEGGRVDPSMFRKARWDLMPRNSYLFASVQTVRGCPKHCSFCSVWRTDGQQPRNRASDAVIEEMVELRRLGFRFIVLADDNFYPVTVEDLRLAERQGNTARLEELKEIRADRFELMARMAELPSDMIFFTQITTEAADDPEYLEAMNKARVKGALIGVESVTEAGLKDVYKDFSSSGAELIGKLRKFRENGVHVLGSFIFGLNSDDAGTFDATSKLAQEAHIAFAQFVTLTPLPGTIDFDRWEKERAGDTERFDGHPMTRYWLIPPRMRPKAYLPHPVMTADEIRIRTQKTWDDFYSIGAIWERASVTPTLRSRMAFLLISKLYRQMYANTGLATDSARSKKAANTWARRIVKPLRRLFHAAPMPELKVPAPIQAPAPARV